MNTTADPMAAERNPVTAITAADVEASRRRTEASNRTNPTPAAASATATTTEAQVTLRARTITSAPARSHLGASHGEPEQGEAADEAGDRDEREPDGREPCAGELRAA